MSDKKVRYKAMVDIYGGGSWATADTKGEAMRKLKKEIKASWSHLFKVDEWLKSGNATCGLWEDMGTDSHDDDVFIANVPLI